MREVNEFLQSFVGLRCDAVERAYRFSEELIRSNGLTLTFEDGRVVSFDMGSQNEFVVSSQPLMVPVFHSEEERREHLSLPFVVAEVFHAPAADLVGVVAGRRLERFEVLEGWPGEPDGVCLWFNGVVMDVEMVNTFVVCQIPPGDGPSGAPDAKIDGRPVVDAALPVGTRCRRLSRIVKHDSLTGKSVAVGLRIVSDAGESVLAQGVSGLEVFSLTPGSIAVPGVQLGATESWIDSQDVFLASLEGSAVTEFARYRDGQVCMWFDDVSLHMSTGLSGFGVLLSPWLKPRSLGEHDGSAQRSLEEG